MRAVLLAVTTAALLAVAPEASASRTASPWEAYVAPASACPGSDTTHPTRAEARTAMTCLVNWLRARIGLRQLAWSSSLASVATTKASTIARCDQFSHYPCGSGLATPTPYDVFGENLYYGQHWLESPRAALLAWLESPEHRAILFGGGWSALGVTVLHARSLDGQPKVALWVLEVAGKT